ncbi:MAG: YciI family protein [Vicinamibacteria bacterium]|nr:YciI family protein [Vicinamibacteria bacterium]
MKTRLAALALVAALPALAQAPAPAASPAASPETFVAPTGQTMRRYVFGLLSRGDQWTPERTPETEKLQAGHMANIGRMAAAKKLVAAGPMADPQSSLRGIFVFATSVADAQAEAAQDPAIAAGRLKLDLLEWWGPVGVGDQYWKDQAEGKKTEMGVHALGFLVSGTLPVPPADAQKIQAGHMDHIVALMKSGKLLAAGPFVEPGQKRGIFVFAPEVPLDEAKALAAQDPAVAAGHMALEFHPWYHARGTFPKLP